MVQKVFGKVSPSSSLIFLLPGLFLFVYTPSPIQFLSSNETLALDYGDAGHPLESELKHGGSQRQLLRAATQLGSDASSPEFPQTSQRPLVMA